MIQHQPTNSIGKVYNSVAYTNTFWNTHIHKAFELITVFEGSLNAKIGGIDYSLSAGDSALIPPYVAHSFESNGGDVTVITVFSEHYISQFSNVFVKKHPSSFKFVLEDNAKLYAFQKLLYPNDKIEEFICIDEPDEIFIKSALCVIVSEFIAKSTFVPQPQDNSLLFQLLKYIEENYLFEISLKSMSCDLNYNYSYVSRILNNYFGVSFSKLLNQYRVEKAKLLIDSTDKTLSEIALESGFSSTRTFNRCFFEIDSRTPTEYKKRLTKNEYLS